MYLKNLSIANIAIISNLANKNEIVLKKKYVCIMGYDIEKLTGQIKGSLHTDDLHKMMYATDASVYKAHPMAVAYPMDEQDIIAIIRHCQKHGIPVIPRATGTSLAGQCVGTGIIIDISRYMTKIYSVDKKRKEVTVDPGVIRDDLNRHLEDYGLLFGPNTSTANRATIGGMIGNNSCGSTSITYGVTRDYVKEMEVILSDGSKAVFGEISKPDFDKKCQISGLEGNIYRFFQSIYSGKKIYDLIEAHFPEKSVGRRNTGYALDVLANADFFQKGQGTINLCKILAGSEGTLGITTKVKIGLVDIPPKHEVLAAIHYSGIDECLRSVPYIMVHKPFACEMMDKTILDCTKGQPTYQKDRDFLCGDPQAILLVSVKEKTIEEGKKKIYAIIESLKSQKMGYAFPVMTQDIQKIWNLRSAGLGLLANLPGDKKAVACIEDTAVNIQVLADYIAEFTEMMIRYGQKSVYYAHAGAGELHLRPILDLKKESDRVLFYKISKESAQLVKKYRGSLSGEHGDGRVRAPFIRDFYGQQIYDIMVRIKDVWDPNNIFNPGKIVYPKPLTEDLRFGMDHQEKAFKTLFDFSHDQGILRAVEKCNGSGDCRKPVDAGGTMCPSFMATRDEKNTTRARANALREILTNHENPWQKEELKEVMDLCLSCKGCTAECPSSIDMSTMKAEYLYQYYQSQRVPFRSWFFAHYNEIMSLTWRFSSFTNVFSNKKVIKKLLGIHQKRSIPRVTKTPLRSRWKSIERAYLHIPKKDTVYLFCDEFTNFQDVDIGQKSIALLMSLGVEVKMIDHHESGRAAISKGLLDKAKRHATANVKIFSKRVTARTPLIGIEPSAILTFRDEYPRLVDQETREDARLLSNHVYTIEEYLYDGFKKGRWKPSIFHDEEKHIMLHGHCHQKALADLKEAAYLLSLPENYTVEIIPSGCCGMAGSFGYEKEHYDISMKIGEMVLFPTIREKKNHIEIVASGTSCRHQIQDGTGARSKHPVEILWEALDP